jgi:hypothetical protein
MQENIEIWKDIPGYEGVYQVSNLGNVFSLKKKRKMIGQKNNGGYIYVKLNKKQKYIHRLVAISFIDNENNFPQINHIDENKANNNVKNLEWCTAKYNRNYGTSSIRISEKQLNDKNKSKAVLQKKDGVIINEFPSTKEVYRKLGYNFAYISACCLGKYKQAYGYQWEYIK